MLAYSVGRPMHIWLLMRLYEYSSDRERWPGVLFGTCSRDDVHP